MERIQLYGCPLDAEVAETWDRDALLTDVLCEYIDRFNVLRVFDLLAIDAYRQLIDWQRIADSGTDVLHCFDASPRWATLVGRESPAPRARLPFTAASVEAPCEGCR